MSIWNKLEIARKYRTLGNAVSAGVITKQECEQIVKYNNQPSSKKEPASFGIPLLFGWLLGGMFK